MLEKYNMPTHGGRIFYKTKKRVKSATTIQRAFRKMQRRKNGGNKPRNTISQNPLSAPNKYNFMRSFASSINIGIADTQNNIFMNTDNKCQIIKLRVKLAQLPDYTDFQALFNQYKITSVKSHLIPFYKDNIPHAYGAGAGTAPAIPNYQVFYVPENYMIDIPAFQSKTIAQIDDYINQSQKKAYAIFPNRPKKFWNKKPSVPDVIFEEKAGASIPGKMVRFPFIDANIIDVEAYGLQLLIMRVDRLQFNPTGATDNTAQHMGWRVQHDVYLQTRKVQ